MRDPVRIIGASDFVKAGQFVMSEFLRLMTEEGDAEALAKFTACIDRGELPMLTLRGLSDGSGSVIELVTQDEGENTFTRHKILPMLIPVPGSAIN